MIQALDLARENAMLKDEVDRLRRELAESVQTTRGGPPGSSGIPWPDDFASSDDFGASVGDRLGALARLMLIMPRYRAPEYGLFAGRFASVPDCKVIVDRRVGERRRGESSSLGGERRRGDRRSIPLDSPDALVLSVR
ncbi:MAG: hypothetical protein DMD83_07710 [Candidatus Rokuibacteriota bacterium]|nr:MAG: hypothetical protein DMD83_07710 [Candidatus Rokubacteria bacterium]